MDSLPIPSQEISLLRNPEQGMAVEAAPPSGPWVEDPSWTGLDLLLLACVVFLGIVFFTAVAMGVVHGVKGQPLAEMAGNLSVWIVVPAEGGAYLVMFAVLYWLVGRRGLPLWPALNWQWPRGFGACGFLLMGFVLAFAAGLLQKVLPMPKELPIEKLFFQPGAPQLLALFGVLVAPLVEETLFRGVLYPVANRWLRGVLNSQPRLRRAGLVFLGLIPWGFLARWRPPLVSAVLAVGALVATAVVCASRSDRGRPAEAVRAILPGITFSALALVASRLSLRSWEGASIGLLCASLLMMLLSVGLRSGITATRIGIGLSFVLTAISFALLHGEQLGGYWAPILVLSGVSVVLTFVRASSKSLAASVLVHVGYNATLFGGMYIATDHFRHLEQLTR